MIVASSLLFLTGMAFAYFLVFPVVFGFIVGTAPQGVAVMTDIGNYLRFCADAIFCFWLGVSSAYCSGDDSALWLGNSSST